MNAESSTRTPSIANLPQISLPERISHVPYRPTSAPKAVMYSTLLSVVQYRALQGGWKEKKLSGYDKLSVLGDTRVNNCTVLIFNYLILFS